MLKKNDLFWIVPAACLSLLEAFFRSDLPPFEGGIYYIFFTFIYIGMVFCYHFKYSFDSSGFSGLGLSIGVILLLFSSPLFENDHYRYLFEGHAFLKGYNPYTHAPSHKAFTNINFLYKERIAFDHLTTLYPPGALIWFGLGGIFGYSIGIKVLMILNGLLVFYLYKKLFKMTNPLYLYLLIPFFQKEYIQGVHIDLLAALALALTFFSRTWWQGLLGIGLSYWVKILGLFMMPLYFLDIFKKKSKFFKMMMGFFVAISLPLTILFLMDDPMSLSGAKMFGRHWVWNPGFYALLVDGLKIHELDARKITTGLFALYFLIIAVLGSLKFRQQNFKIVKRQKLLYGYLLFSGLMFFSPVFNSWYSVWFLLPGLLLHNFSSVMYGAFSCLGYIYYGQQEYYRVGEFLTHLWFPLSLLEEFAGLKISEFLKKFKLK